MAGRIKTVKFTRELTAEDKLAPQAKGIVESVIETHGVNTEVTVEQIVAAMEGNITTRQPLERIFGYYAPKLEEAELIVCERSAAAAPKAKKEGGEAVDGDLSDELEDEDENEDA